MCSRAYSKHVPAIARAKYTRACEIRILKYPYDAVFHFSENDVGYNPL